MYVLKDGDGRETPITYTHHESYPGEARDIILSAFCVDTALYDEYETMDTVEDKEMTLVLVSVYGSPVSLTVGKSHQIVRSLFWY